MTTFSAVALSHLVARAQTQLAKDLEDGANLKASKLLQARERRQRAEYQRVINRTRNIAYQAAAHARRLQHRRQVQNDREQRLKREALQWKIRLQANLASVEKLIHDMPSSSVIKAYGRLHLIWLMLLKVFACLSGFLSRRVLTTSFPT
ncbi:hypothetical protein PV08_11857 [Exophiala spinifera]|uniref:Uncharacterized protein n=1 Tax=Exophiala spinifera TaxID=91928 RepID=A0A0D1Z9T3_9EURO|nr:uncharacterized protein PV08_11857 [Exophiala spinifera]KIW09757.1 hypothetical protein PV08_11857 [Exophiala spinifera]